MPLKINKLELEIDENTLTEIVVQENKEDYERENITDFKIKISPEYLQINGIKHFSIIPVSFKMKAEISLSENNLVKLQVLSVKALSFIPVPKSEIVKGVVSQQKKGVYEGGKDYFFIDPLADSPYQFEVTFKKLECLEGKLKIYT